MKDPSVNTRTRQIFAQLQALFPTMLPTLLNISTKLGPDVMGDCAPVERGEKTYLLIRIQSGLNLNHTIELLFHEYAHARNWLPHPFEEIDTHGPHWGLYLSELCLWWDEAPR